MKAHKRSVIAYPCDCISATPSCAEPWARVAKEGMFKDGTKEELLGALARGPMTIAQLAKEVGLSQPTVFRHMADLSRHRLVREIEPEEKEYAFERYYTPSFPVISRKDQAEFAKDLESLARALARATRKYLPRLRERYGNSDVAREGWAFEEAVQYMLHMAQRKARQELEREGTLARKFTTTGLDFAFWATE